MDVRNTFRLMMYRGGLRIIAGIDGCPQGWVCVIQDLATSKIDARLFNKIDEIRSVDPIPKVIAIDIPIGLADSGTREADALALQMLKQKASTVFPAPIRHVLAAKSFGEANTMCREKINKGMSIQSWSIVRKIREVDNLLRNHPHLLNVIFEVHPELSFLAMNGGAAQLYGKKKKEGKISRKILVNNLFGQRAYESVRNLFRKKRCLR